jgi:hypothetical protein
MMRIPKTVAGLSLLGIVLLLTSAGVGGEPEWFGEVVKKVADDGKKLYLQKNNRVAVITEKTKLFITENMIVQRKDLAKFLNKGDVVDLTGKYERGQWICSTLKKVQKK